MWAALIRYTKLKDFKRQRDKFMTEAKIEALSQILASSLGMASIYWVLTARQFAKDDSNG